MDLSLGSFHDYEATDKREHVLVGYAVGVTSAALAERLLPRATPAVRFVTALVPVLAVAVGKEAYDRRHSDRHDCDARDAYATTAGGVVGALCITVTLHF